MTRLERIAAGLACGAAFASSAAHVSERTLAGVVLRVDPRTPSPRASPLETRAIRISSDALLFDPKVGREPARATFEGFLWAEQHGQVQLRLRGNTPGRVWLEDTQVLPSLGSEGPDRATVTLRPGSHRLRAELDMDRKLPVFRVSVGTRRNDPEGNDPLLFPAPPGGVGRLVVGSVVPRLRLLGRVLGLAAGALGLWLVLGWPGGARLEGADGSAPGATTRVWVCALAIVAYAGLLRVESVVRQHWGLEAPAWARHATELATELRPAALKQVPAQHPYLGDPANYLRFAREMEHFYDAHVREPLFVAATHVALRMTGDADVGISLTSAFFSTLLVGATFLMGARAFAPGVGLVAALLLAVERDVIGLAAEGWRDDTFAFWVAAFAAAMLGTLARPSLGRALGLGLVGGAAALTRITALSFLLPALAFAGWESRKTPLATRRLALAALVTAALLAPFLATSRIAFGDAFHSINAHTTFYRARAALPADPPMRWPEYLARSFAPGELVGNLAVGLTVHPFESRWQPFALWARPAPGPLRLLSLVGLVLFLTNRRGRLLLVVLLTALVPFAFTFRITGGNEGRFTLLAYPFYLVAAALALERARAWLAARMP